jgi:hypothetical protein
MQKDQVLKGRPMGGVSVFIKNDLLPHVKRVCELFEFGVVLLIEKYLFSLS